MIDALEKLQEREDELGKKIFSKRRDLETLENEAKLVAKAVMEQRKTIEALDKPTRTRGGKSTRPWARRDPGEHTSAGKVLAVVRDSEVPESGISVSEVQAKTGLPPSTVRTTLYELSTKRGLIDRVSEGHYKAKK